MGDWDAILTRHGTGGGGGCVVGTSLHCCKALVEFEGVGKWGSVFASCVLKTLDGVVHIDSWDLLVGVELDATQQAVVGERVKRVLGYGVEVGGETSVSWGVQPWLLTDGVHYNVAKCWDVHLDVGTFSPSLENFYERLRRHYSVVCTFTAESSSHAHVSDLGTGGRRDINGSR